MSILKKLFLRHRGSWQISQSEFPVTSFILVQYLQVILEDNPVEHYMGTHSGCIQTLPANIRQGQNGLLRFNTGPGVNKPDTLNGASLR